MKTPKSFAGSALRDRKTNRGVTTELSTCNFNDVIVDYITSWTYLLGMNDTHITKLVYEEEAVQKVDFTLCLMVMRDAKRPLGRPRRRWVDNIRTDLQEVGCGYMDWIRLA